MGCLEEDLDPEIKEVMEGVDIAIRRIGDVMMDPPFWKISKRLSPKFMEMDRGMSIFAKLAKVTV